MVQFSHIYEYTCPVYRDLGISQLLYEFKYGKTPEIKGAQNVISYSILLNYFNIRPSNT